jgi:hypothetical protein
MLRINRLRFFGVLMWCALFGAATAQAYQAQGHQAAPNAGGGIPQAGTNTGGQLSNALAQQPIKINGEVPIVDHGGGNFNPPVLPVVHSAKPSCPPDKTCSGTTSNLTCQPGQVCPSSDLKQ